MAESQVLDDFASSLTQAWILAFIVIVNLYFIVSFYLRICVVAESQVLDGFDSWLKQA
ncbi:hypothetical protein [Basilea psittacipulmonis]|uniref:hypothetical protein n=1 Tax=Basilea psittacipulmonis TaxID=1472345 RepID=UPI00130E09BF|nr:hypothetical protein [Basilea psittacipulmonis]